MPIDNEWRGDAPAIAQVTNITITKAVAGSQYGFTINGKSLVVPGADDPAAVGLAIAAAWQQSTVPEFQEIDCVASGGGVTLTARTAGKPFEVEVSFPALIVVTRTQGGLAYRDQETSIALPATTTGGTWTLTAILDGEAKATADLAWNITAAALETAINGLANIPAAAATVEDAGNQFVFTFDATAVGSTVTITTNGDDLIGNGTVSVQTVQTPGDDVHEIQASAFTAVETDGSQTFRIRNPATGDESSVYNAGIGSLQNAFDEAYGAAVVDVFEVQAADAFGRQYRLFAVRWKTPGDVSGGLFEVSGSFTYGSYGTTRIQAGGGDEKNEVVLCLDQGQTSGAVPDVYTLNVDGQATADIPVGSQPDAAIEALSTVGAGNADQPLFVGEQYATEQGDDFSIDMYVLTFVAGKANTNLTVTNNGSTATVVDVQNGGPLANEIQRVTVNGNGGTWKLADEPGGTPTAAIAYAAAAATVETALDALYGAGNVAVTKVGGQYDVEFVAALATTNVDLMGGDGSSLTGGTNPTTNILTQPVIGRDEVQQLTIDDGAIGGTFRLLSESITDDVAWNATAQAIEAALESLVEIGVGNVAVTGPVTGPFGIAFIGDRGDQPIDLLVPHSDDLIVDATLLGVETAQRSRGPEHWDDPLNWTRAQVPDDNERPVFRRGKAGPKYGLRQRATFAVLVDDPATSTVETTTTKLRSVADFVTNQRVRVTTTGTLPAGLTAGTNYYVLSNDRDSGILDLRTLAGAAVQITDAGTGVHTLGVEFDGLLQWAPHTGPIGLPRLNKNGKYWEYRTRELCCGLKADTRITIGQGEDGSGSGLVRLNTGDYAVHVELIASGPPADSDAQAVYWTGFNASNVLEVLDGSIDLDNCTLLQLLQRAGTVVGSDSVEFVSGGMIDRTGGDLYLHSATAGDRVLRLRG